MLLLLLFVLVALLFRLHPRHPILLLSSFVCLAAVVVVAAILVVGS